MKVSCLPMFAMCTTAADVNKDGVVDRHDAVEAATIMAKVLEKTLDEADVYVQKFNAKVDKLIMFLDAAKIIFGADPEAAAMIDTAITTLRLFKLATAAGTDVAAQVKTITLPKDSVQLGVTIGAMQESLATVETYMARFEAEGIKFGVLSTDLKKVDAAFAKMSDMQKAYVAINTALNTPPATPTNTQGDMAKVVVQTTVVSTAPNKLSLI